MIFPRDTTVYENLNTSFTNFTELLADLKAQEITGYVQVNFPDYEGVVFLDGGSVLNAVESPGSALVTGQPAMRGIEARVGGRNGVISVYTLQSTIVSTLATVVDSEALYRDLSTSFTSLDRLITKLQSEGHTGYIEVLTPEGKSFGYVYFRNGEAVESVLCADGESLSGIAAVPRVVQTATEMGATFHVFRATMDAPPAGFAVSANGATMHGAAPPATPDAVPAEPERVAYAAPAPTDAEESADVTAYAEMPSAAEASLSDAVEDDELVLEATHEDAEPEAEPEPDHSWVDEARIRAAGDNAHRQVDVWQEILGRVESVVDRVSAPGTFLLTFKRALLAEAGRFPFLDPFAAEFEYRDGTITLYGTPGPDFSTGLGTCLRGTIATVTAQLKRGDLETLIRATLVETVARNAAVIERYDLRSTLSEYLS